MCPNGIFKHRNNWWLRQNLHLRGLSRDYGDRNAQHGDPCRTDDEGQCRLHVSHLYLGKKPDGLDNSKYLALSNLIVGCIPTAASEPFAQIQIYPNLDYLWRYNLPAFVWKMAGPVIARLRHRLAWARLYVHSAYSQSYECEMPDERGEMRLRVTSPPECTQYMNQLMSSIRKVFNNDDFYIPPITPIRERTNSHYAGTLPFNGQSIPVSSNGELIPRIVYVCDASTSPTSPAVSPTFSIVANACRVATEALNE